MSCCYSVALGAVVVVEAVVGGGVVVAGSASSSRIFAGMSARATVCSVRVEHTRTYKNVKQRNTKENAMNSRRASANVP